MKITCCVISFILIGGYGSLNGSTRAIQDKTTATQEEKFTPRQKLENLASTLAYFETEFVVGKRQLLRTYPDALGYSGGYASDPFKYYPTVWPESLAKTHAKMLTELRDIGVTHGTLAGLLKDEDPHIRTLAAAALFFEKDRCNIPMISTLLEDRGVTWPVYDLEEPKPPDKHFTISPHAQIVSQVAREMVDVMTKGSYKPCTAR